MTVSVLIGGLVFAALLPLVLPLLQYVRPAPDRREYECAVYRDQLLELDREVARGLVSETDAAASRLEIQRRLLAADAAAAAPARGWVGQSPMAALIVAIFCAVGALVLYERLGAPATPDIVFVPRPPLAGATAGVPVMPPHFDLQQAAERLAGQLRNEPDNVDAWVRFGRTSASLHHWDIAADAYRHALALGINTPEVRVGLGEMMVMQAGGIVTPAANETFAALLQDDPKNEVARYYRALAAAQAGQPAEAIRQMQALLADIPEDSAIRAEIATRIAEAARAAGLPVPELARGKPALPPDPGADTVEVVADAATVATLATRMEAEPGNVKGWMRLGRAYAALHDTEKAADALDRAVALVPGDTAIRLQAVRVMLTGLTPEDPLPPRAVDLLRQVEAIDPDEPRVLWYLGAAAAQDAHPEDARRYWTRLLARLPAEGQNAGMVRAAMDQLNGG
jgi:cytochrome c-type biogenesis protein CcmH